MRNKTFLLIAVLLTSTLAVFGQDRYDAVELYRTGDYQGAIEVCRKELEEMPNRMDAHAVMGWSLLKLERYQEALEASQVAFRISRYDPRIIEIAGEALFYLGRQAEALGYFEEYAAISPTGGRIDMVYYFMGEIFIQQSKFNNADIALSTAVYHSPNVASWWARLGYARERGGDFQWSLEAYNKALALNPNLVDALRGRSRVQAQL
ncbi:MAG: tetratricopeptide repeat protein [Spirochaetales bacterium]|nr:tetratricopeptide repeat protein [Spirochaetales bacterium]